MNATAACHTQQWRGDLSLSRSALCGLYRQDKLTTTCYTKLSVEAKKGSAILFYSQHPSGALDDMSVHGACPVLAGSKWSANVWVWNRCRYGLRCPDMAVERHEHRAAGVLAEAAAAAAAGAGGDAAIAAS